MGPTLVERCYDNRGDWSSRSCHRLFLVFFFHFFFFFFFFFFDTSFIVYAFFCATLLGSAAAFVLNSLGGTNISPAHLLLGFLALRLIGDRRVFQKIVEGILPGRAGFLLLVPVV